MHICIGAKIVLYKVWGWSGGAMVLGKLLVPGRPTILITVGQGPTVLAVGADGLDIFTLNYPFFSFSNQPKKILYKVEKRQFSGTDSIKFYILP